MFSWSLFWHSQDLGASRGKTVVGAGFLENIWLGLGSEPTDYLYMQVVLFIRSDCVEDK